MTEIDEAIGKQISRLDSIVNLLESYKPISHRFKLKFGNPEWSRFDKELQGKSFFIYIIRTTKGDKVNILKAFEDFKEIRKTDYRLSSINKNSNFRQVLYVGTSALGATSLKNRLRQHLGICGPKVFSLQLAQWLCPIVEEVEVEIFPIDATHSDALYALENALWDFYTPLFGKKGVNVNTSSKL